MSHRIMVPVVDPETGSDLIRMAAASAHAHEDENAEVMAVNVIKVTQQTILSREPEFEAEHIKQRRALLSSARDIVSEFNVGLRTREIVGRNAGSAVLKIIKEENVDHVLLHWNGTRSVRNYVLGSSIDPVVGRASCDVTLVTFGPEGDWSDSVLVLVGQGPHTPIAARRGAEFATKGKLGFLNVQEPDHTDDNHSPEGRRGDIIETLIAETGVMETFIKNAEELCIERSVAVTADIEQAILTHASEYDTICIGAPRSGPVARAIFGSLPETISEKANCTVVTAHGTDGLPMSVREAIVRQLKI